MNLLKDPNCQSIPGKSQSPPRKIFEFGYRFTLTSAMECDKSSNNYSNHINLYAVMISDNVASMCLYVAAANDLVVFHKFLS